MHCPSGDAKQLAYEGLAMSTPAALQSRRDYDGPALFSYGFRPFFLAAGLWAAFGILLWVPQYMGSLNVPTHMSPLDWHIHEMLYGYVAASIAGFLLTAIPNWTGRLPVSGWPLAGLALLWLAGRVVILLSAHAGGLVAAFVDVSFLVTLAVVAAREIIAGKNWRNLRVLAVLGLLILGNVVFHAEVLLAGAANYGIRTTIAASVLALVTWIVAPTQPFCGVLLIFAGCLQVFRLARWAGDRTVADRLVLVLHIGYAFVPIGFVLVGLSTFTLAVPPTAGLHAWTAGAIGLMTVAVMTRATLGHTGQPLQAGRATQAIYGLLLTAALVRVVAAFFGLIDLLEFAGAAWIAAFVLFVLLYGPLLAMRKPAWAQSRC